MLIKESLDLNTLPNQKSPISISDMVRLYNNISWYTIVHNPVSDTLINTFAESYGNYLSINIIKALILPFLINIPTERALARELEERGILQSICGFPPGDAPSRGTIWNFRRKYQKIYPEVLIKVLTIFGVCSVDLNLRLPFVYSYNEEDILENLKSEFFYIPQKITSTQTSNNPLIHIKWWQSKNEICKHRDEKVDNEVIYKKKIEELHSARDWKEWERIENTYIEREKSWLINDLTLPVKVHAIKKDSEDEAKELFFNIDAPEWLEVHGRDRDTIIGYGSSAIPYIACNVLVFRKHSGKKQILMTKRQSGFGEGTYALPGGKLQTGETAEECAKRELREETSILPVKSRPVSLKITHFPGKPWVISIGVLVEEYEGRPQTIEKSQHGEWQWYDIDKLPEALFEPTRIVISQYLSHLYPNLMWSDLEAIIKKEVGQLPLFG